MKKTSTLILLVVLSLFSNAQVFDFFNSIYYLSPDASTAPGTVLTNSGTNLSGFDYNTAPVDHPLYTNGIYYPVLDCSDQNLWVRLQHVAADPNGTKSGFNISASMNSPFLPWGTTDRIGGWNGFLYEFQIFVDEVVVGERNNVLGDPFPTAITVASLETLYNDGGYQYEWLSFEILNEESSGWFLNSTNFTGINPYSTPGFSADFNVSTTGTPTEAPTGFSTDFPYGSPTVYAVDMNLSSSYHSEFKMSASSVSKFRYGYEFNSGGYQGMSMSFGIPPIVNALISPPLCYGEDSGNISIEATGTEPITFEWSNETSGSVLDDIASGEYTITVTDANGCSIEQTIYVPQPEPISFYVGNSLGETITLFAESLYGGTPPYYYEWSTGETTETIEITGSGIWTLDITDANGCTMSGEFTIISTGENAEMDNAFYPNPASEHVSFVLPETVCTLEIHNAAGQLVSSSLLQNVNGGYDLDVSQYADGTYTFLIRDDQSFRQVGRLVILH